MRRAGAAEVWQAQPDSRRRETQVHKLGDEGPPAAVGRACTELMLDSGYKTIDLSRLAFDRVLMGKEVRELAGQMLGRT